jgi:signal transduction histidine kinase
MKDEEKTKDQLIAELTQVKREFADYKAMQPYADLSRETIANSPISIHILDGEGFTVLVNSAHTQLFKGVPPKYYNIFTDPLLLEQGLEETLRSLRAGKAVFFPDIWYNVGLYHHRLPDSMIWLKVLAIPILDNEGKPLHYIVLHENIAERKNKEKETTEKTQQLKEKGKYIENIRILERQSIHREIHDELSQVLTRVKIMIGNTRDLLTDAALKKVMEDAFVLTDHTMIAVGKILKGLQIDNHHDISITLAIKKYCKEVSFQSGLNITANLPGKLLLPDGYVHLLFHIFQEALINVCRHAKAKNANVKLWKRNNKLNLTIKDDGQGISDEIINSPHTSGLQSMIDRTAMMNGEFMINRGEDNGTQIHIIIPLVK